MKILTFFFFLGATAGHFLFSPKPIAGSEQKTAYCVKEEVEIPDCLILLQSEIRNDGGVWSFRQTREDGSEIILLITVTGEGEMVFEFFLVPPPSFQTDPTLLWQV